MKSTYLLLDFAAVAFPFIRSFEPKVNFKSYWPYLFPGIVASALYFIPTDIWFTAKGWWGFSDKYILGPRLWGLPLEEYLFFLVVPYACTFIYACLEKLAPVKDGIFWSSFGWGLVALGSGLALTHLDLAYTSIKVGSTTFFLVLFLLDRRGRGLGNFFACYLISLIPFLLMNGALTWLPVVWYNNAENLSLRFSDLTGVPFFNIPVEDAYYALGMLLLTIATMDRLRRAYQRGEGDFVESFGKNLQQKT